MENMFLLLLDTGDLTYPQWKNRGSTNSSVTLEPKINGTLLCACDFLEFIKGFSIGISTKSCSPIYSVEEDSQAGTLHRTWSNYGALTWKSVRGIQRGTPLSRCTWDMLSQARSFLKDADLASDYHSNNHCHIWLMSETFRKSLYFLTLQ